MRKNTIVSVYFFTFGCRLNQAETKKFQDDIRRRGCSVAGSPERAGVIVLNTCSVTEKAQKALDKKIDFFCDKHPNKKIVVIGCGAKDKYSDRAIVLTNKEKDNLFEYLSIGENKAQKDRFNNRTRILYKVQDGCNNFCTYCIVPFLRGREKGIDVDTIIKELIRAENEGYKEVVLCGVNIGKYIDGDTNLVGLIKQILKETKIPRIRLSSINPEDITDEIIDLWNREKRLCNHFHLSLQSGSDTVLSRMGRKYDTDYYRELVAKLRDGIEDIMITTDIIVGFPGESAKEFRETCLFLDEINFLKIHCFRYSKRKGTKASKMRGRVSEKIKKERAKEIAGINKINIERRLKKYIGKEVEVLFEQEKHGYYSGFTRNYIKVNKKSNINIANKMIRVKIKGRQGNNLYAY